MSTRANIIIQDEWDQLFFYRHSDGYPEGTMPSLEKLLGWVKSNKIRNNACQASGWLILLGAKEYNKSFEPTSNSISGWKCGAFEPTAGLHGDIEYLYVVDLETKKIEVHTEYFDHYVRPFER